MTNYDKNSGVLFTPKTAKKAQEKSLETKRKQAAKGRTTLTKTETQEWNKMSCNGKPTPLSSMMKDGEALTEFVAREEAISAELTVEPEMAFERAVARYEASQVEMTQCSASWSKLLGIADDPELLVALGPRIIKEGAEQWQRVARVSSANERVRKFADTQAKIDANNRLSLTDAKFKLMIIELSELIEDIWGKDKVGWIRYQVGLARIEEKRRGAIVTSGEVVS